MSISLRKTSECFLILSWGKIHVLFKQVCDESFLLVFHSVIFTAWFQISLKSVPIPNYYLFDLNAFLPALRKKPRYFYKSMVYLTLWNCLSCLLPLPLDFPPTVRESLHPSLRLELGTRVHLHVYWWITSRLKILFITINYRDPSPSCCWSVL